MSLRRLARIFQQETMEAEEAISDLRKFVKLAWPIIEPGTPYVHGWHIDAICEHLMAISDGKIKDLLINVPPRHAKSSIVSVIWPVWEWIQQPHIKWLFSSYAQSLSTRDSLKSRRLIQSPWFQKHYWRSFQLLRDQNTKMRYDNDKAGYRIATSVTGSNTGEGGDRVVCLPYNAMITLKYNKMAIGSLDKCWPFVQVLSYDRLRKTTELKKINQFFATNTQEICVITTINEKKLECTPNHLIYSSKGWFPAKDLTHLDSIFNEQKKFIKIKEVAIEKREIKTFNIEVEDNNNYFANGFLVHNCDDGNNALEGESQAILESTSIWWKEVMSTRKNDPKMGSRIMVGQRVGCLDLSQVFLESSDPVHLCLPAEYEGNKSRTILGWEDPRIEIGDLLWPERFTYEILTGLKKQLGIYGTAGQLQQRPTPREGGIIKLAWLKYYKLQRDNRYRIIKPTFQYIIQSWDTAFKDGEQNDFSVCITFGLVQDGFYIINRWKDKVDFPELEKKTIELANIYNPNELVIEDKASAQSLIQCLKKRTKLKIKAVNPDRDKIARLYSISPIIESGMLYLPEDEAWVPDYVDNLVKFPGAVHDDDVDATSQALILYGLNKSNIFDSNRKINIMGR
jgi:predicted phage terminase large subunit-like protein